MVAHYRRCLEFLVLCLKSDSFGALKQLDYPAVNVSGTPSHSDNQRRCGRQE